MKFRNTKIKWLLLATLILFPVVDGAALSKRTDRTTRLLYGLKLTGAGAASGTANGLLTGNIQMVKIVFSPGFYPTSDGAGVNRTLVHSTQAGYLLQFLDSTTKNLIFYCGNTLVVSVAPASYLPYWQHNYANTLIAKCDTDANSNTITLNGVQVGSSSTNWTAITSAATIYIGSRSESVDYFKGVIHSVEIFNAIAMTDASRLAFWDFRGDYKSWTSSANNLSATGSGNIFSTGAPQIEYGYKGDYAVDTTSDQTAGYLSQSLYEVLTGTFKISADTAPNGEVVKVLECVGNGTLKLHWDALAATGWTLWRNSGSGYVLTTNVSGIIASNVVTMTAGQKIILASITGNYAIRHT